MDLRAMDRRLLRNRWTSRGAAGARQGRAFGWSASSNRPSRRTCPWPRRSATRDVAMMTSSRGSEPATVVHALAVAALVVPQLMVVLVQGAAPLLLREAPLLLLALHPFEPWSVLVAARTDTLTFVAVVVGVRVVPACGGYLVGRWYGTTALDRLSRTRWLRRWTHAPQLLSRRTAMVLLVLFPGATASVLAGVTRLRATTFLPLMLTGLVLGALLSRTLAALAAGPVTALAGFLDRHVILLGAAVIVVVALVEVLQRRRAEPTVAGHRHGTSAGTRPTSRGRAPQADEPTA